VTRTATADAEAAPRQELSTLVGCRTTADAEAAPRQELSTLAGKQAVGTTRAPPTESAVPVVALCDKQTKSSKDKGKDYGKDNEPDKAPALHTQPKRKAESQVQAVAAVQHVAVATEDIDPAELFLVPVFQFLARIGWRFSAQETERPSSFKHFVEDPPMVQQALEEWLLEEGWLLKGAAIQTKTMLALWFHDVDERSSEEESQFFAQWHAYSSRKRLLSRRGGH
jgi:hypothetical protein